MPSWLSSRFAVPPPHPICPANIHRQHQAEDSDRNTHREGGDDGNAWNPLLVSRGNCPAL